MSEPTHGEDDRPAGGRGVDDVRSRPAVRMQEHNRYRVAGNCGIPIWKLSELLRQASLQVSRDMACQEFNPNRIEGCLAPDDTGGNRGVPPRYARRGVSKPNVLYDPASGYRQLEKAIHGLAPVCRPLQEGTEGINIFDVGGARKVGNVMVGPSPSNNTAGTILNRKP